MRIREVSTTNQGDKYFHSQTRIDRISNKWDINILTKTNKTQGMHSTKEEVTITVSRTALRS